MMEPRHYLKNFPARTLLLSGWLIAVLALAAAARADVWRSFAGNAHHTGLSSSAAQPLEVVHWSIPVDLAPPSGEILIHYGPPLVSPGNTVIVPVKTGSAGGFMVKALAARDGSLIWSQASDYILPPHNWMPSFSPALTRGNRLYFPGAGGTVLYRDRVDSGRPSPSGRLGFFGLANYNANT